MGAWLMGSVAMSRGGHGEFRRTVDLTARLASSTRQVQLSMVQTLGPAASRELLRYLSRPN